MEYAVAQESMAGKTKFSVSQWLGCASVTGLVVILYAPVLIALATDWWIDPGASHGFLIPPLALYVAYTRRDRTFALPAREDGRGLLLVALACLLLLLGKLSAEFFVSRFSFVLLLGGLTWTFWGWPRARTLAFPLVLLATMIPLPTILYNSLAVSLQLFASQVSTVLAQALGVTVHTEGNVIHLAGISLGVAEACSGLRSLSSLVVMAVLLGFLQCTRARTRVVLLLLAFPIAIAVNVLRVTGTAVLADHNQELALGFYHSFSSWLIFLVGMAGVMATTRLLRHVFESGRKWLPKSAGEN